MDAGSWRIITASLPGQAVMRGRARRITPAQASGASAWLKSYVDEGASLLVLRFAGDHERNLETFARLRGELGW